MPRLRTVQYRLLVLVIVVAAATSIFALYIGFQMQSEDLPRYGMGGVAIIAKETYVLTREPKNTILGGSSIKWNGAAAAESQIAFVSPIVVWFSPDQIRFFNFSTFTGGNYLRDSPTASNQTLQRTASGFAPSSLSSPPPLSLER